jgi:hypothetical protein
LKLNGVGTGTCRVEHELTSDGKVAVMVAPHFCNDEHSTAKLYIIVPHRCHL